MIVAGGSAYARKIDFSLFREIADEVGAYLMVDMAHIAGLIAAGLHESPIPYADVVTSTTHKTLRGPRGGLILAKEQYGKAINSAIFPGIQGGPLEHVIAGKAVAFKEAMMPEFKDYAAKIIKNAKAMEDVFNASAGHLISRGTDSPFKTSGIRIGTPAITTRGFDEEDSKKVAELIVATLETKDHPEKRSAIKKEVLELTKKNPLYK